MATIPKSITERYKMNGASIYQPDKDMGYNLETTYSEGSNRTQFGKALLTPLFTVEQYSYEASNVPVIEANKILKIIAKGKTFNLYHWSFTTWHGELIVLCRKSKPNYWRNFARLKICIKNIF